MLEIIGSVLGSVLSGGATGIIGAAVQRFADYKNKQLDMALEKQRADSAQALREIDVRVMEKEWAGRLQVVHEEGVNATERAAEEAFGKSYDLEPKRYSEGVPQSAFTAGALVLLDVVRGIVRPGLTIYLCVLTTLIYLQARALTDSTVEVSPEHAHALLLQIVSTVLYLTTTVVLWWFGTRNKQAAPTR